MSKQSLKLIITVDGKDVSQETSLNHFVIGRASDCDVIINGEGISRKHLRVIVHGQMIQIEDQKTTYGTFIGSNKIEPNKSYIYDGTLPIYLGSQRVSLRIEKHLVEVPIEVPQEEPQAKEETIIVKPKKAANDYVSSPSLKVRPSTPPLSVVTKKESSGFDDRARLAQVDIQALNRKGQEIKTVLNKLAKDKKMLEIETAKAEEDYQKILLKVETEEYHVQEAIKTVRAFTEDLKEIVEEKDSLIKKNTDLARFAQQYQENIKHLETKSHEMQNQLQTLEGSYTSKLNVINEFENKLEEKKQELTRVQSEKIAAENFISEFSLKKLEYDNELKKLEETKNKWMTQTAMYNAEMSVKEMAIQSVNKAIEELSHKSSHLNEQILKLNSEIADAEVKKDLLVQESYSTQKHIDLSRLELNDLLNKKKEFSTSVDQLKITIDSYKNEIHDLEKLKSEHSTLKEDVTRITQNKSLLQKEIDQVNALLANKHQEKEILEAACTKLIKEVELKSTEKAQIESTYLKYKNDISSYQEQKNSLENLIKSLKEQKEHFISEKSRYEIEHNRVERAFIEIKSDHDKISSQVESKKSDLENLLVRLNQSQEELKGAVQTHARLTQESQDYSQLLEKQKVQIQQNNDTIINLENVIAKTKSDSQKFSTESHQIELRLEELKKNFSFQQQKLDEATNQEKAAQTQTQNLNSEADSLERRIEQYKRQDSDLQKKLEAGQNQLNTLQLENHSLAERNTHLSQEISARLETEYKEQKSKVEAQIKDMFKSAELQMAEMRFKANTQMEEEANRLRKDIENKKRDEVNIVAKNISTQLDLKIKKLIADAQGPEKIKSEINHIIQNVLLNDYLSENERKKSQMIYAVEEVKSNKDYWAKLGLKIGGSILAIALLFIFSDQISQLKSKVGRMIRPDKSDAEEYAKAQIEQRRRENTFVPQMSPEFKSTFTDNIIFTTNYKETVTSEEFLDQWSIELNKYFKEKLKLGENTIVDYMPLETSLHRQLLENRNIITVQTEKQIIEKMRRLEGDILDQMAQSVGGVENLKKVLIKHREFYLRYTQSSQ